MARRTPSALPARARAASHGALRLYPGAVGELLARELSAWGEFGHRFGSHELVTRLITHLDEIAARERLHMLKPARRPRAATAATAAATDIAASIAQLRHPEIRTVLYAGLFARRSGYPGPVGELLARELDGYVDNDMCLAPSALLRRVLDELLTLPGAPQPQPARPPHRPTHTQRAA